MATLNDVLLELVSAQSALNMPNPTSCSKEFVVHAYEHISKAIELLSSGINVSSKEECPDIYYDNTTGMVQVDVDRILTNGGYDLHNVADCARSVLADRVRKLADAWTGFPLRPEYHFERSFRNSVLRYAAELGFPKSTSIDASPKGEPNGR